MRKVATAHFSIHTKEFLGDADGCVKATAHGPNRVD